MDLIRLLDATTQEALLDRWMDRAMGRLPNPTNREEIAVLCGILIESLAVALQSWPWDIDDPSFKDVAKSAGFLGGWLAEHEAPASWLVAALGVLHAEILERFVIDSAAELSNILGETAGAAVDVHEAVSKQRSQENRQELLLTSTPLFRLPSDVPVLTLIGSPTDAVCQELLDRLMVEAVRTDAPAAIVDTTNVATMSTHFSQQLWELASHKHMRSRTICLCDGTDLLRHEQDATAPANLMRFSCITEAIARVSP
ncbi:MAG: hypothetical protein J7M25_10885 [Deltaproteobacteria bacterium]|nr:hypothetical protein [Deltaproteobacteria bacterium]